MVDVKFRGRHGGGGAKRVDNGRKKLVSPARGKLSKKIRLVQAETATGPRPRTFSRVFRLRNVRERKKNNIINTRVNVSRQLSCFIPRSENIANRKTNEFMTKNKKKYIYLSIIL